MTPHMEALLYGSIYLSICFCILGFLYLCRAKQLTRQMYEYSMEEWVVAWRTAQALKPPEDIEPFYSYLGWTREEYSHWVKTSELPKRRPDLILKPGTYVPIRPEED